MMTTFYRGLTTESEYDLDRSDVLALIEPTLLDLLDLTRKLPITRLTIKGMLATVDSDLEKSGGEVSISEHLHNSILDRQAAPEWPRPRSRTVGARDQEVYRGLRDLAFTRNIKGHFYLNPADLNALRFVDDLNMGFNTHIEGHDIQCGVKHGLFGWLYLDVNDTPKGIRSLFVAEEVPEGYVCALQDPDPALMPFCTRQAGLKPKIIPNTLHLISV